MVETNKVYCGNCLHIMAQMSDNVVDLSITSPPYNVGIEYNNTDDNKEWKQYIDTMSSVVKELYRITRSGGRVVWNIPSFSSIQNLYEIFLSIFRNSGFKQYAEIIWCKNQISSRTAWGSFASASEPNILPSHEYILVFYKDCKNHGKGEDSIDKNNFIRYTDGMWRISPETNSNHPAPFPIELPNRCIEMFSYVGELVFDPFCGSGTTLRSAKNLKRNYIGVDISEQYCNIANKRLEQELLF